jgi:hypothetical protein
MLAFLPHICNIAANTALISIKVADDLAHCEGAQCGFERRVLSNASPVSID